VIVMSLSEIPEGFPAAGPEQLTARVP